MALVRSIAELDEVRRPLAVPAAPRIRRCTYRRLSRVSSGTESMYDVSCLYPDRRIPLPLGDLEMSSAICAACTADHIFRPDED